MLDTGREAARRQGSRTGSAAPTTSSPCRCSARPSGTGSGTSSTTATPGTGAPPRDVVTSAGDRVTGIETAALAGSPGAGCCSTSAVRSARHRRGRRRAARRLRDHRRAPRARPSPPRASPVGRGDIVCVRTGQYARTRREGWGDLRRRPCAGPVVHHRRLAARHRDRRDRHRHLGLRGPAQRVRRRLPAPAPDRDPAHRPVHRRDVGPRRAGRRLRGRRPSTTSGSPPHPCASPAPSAPPSTRSPSSDGRGPHARGPNRARGRRRCRRLRHRHPARPRRRRRRPRRGQARRHGGRLGHHAAGQRAACVARPRRVGPRRRRGLRLRHPRHLRARPDGTVLVEMPDAKTGGPDLPGHGRHAPRADLARHAASTAPQRGRREGALRHHRRRPSPRTTPASTSRSPTARTGRYDLVVGADGVRSARRARCSASRSRRRPARHGHLAGVHAPSRRASTRTDLYYGGACYIAGYCPTGEDSSTPTSSRTRRTAPGCRPRSSSPGHARARRGTTTGRGTTSAS